VDKEQGPNREIATRDCADHSKPRAQLLHSFGLYMFEGEMKTLDLKRAVFVSCILLLGTTLPAAYAQRGGNQQGGNQQPGTPAGGKWIESSTEDPMTAAKKVRFELEADKLLRDSDGKAKIILYCVDGKLSLGDFRPNLRLGPPNHPSFWEGRPQMRVLVRVDRSHGYHNWNWVNGNFLAMDKDTVRQMIGSTIFKIQFNSPDGPEIAEFSPAGLDLAKVRKDCGLKPQKP